MSRIERLLNRTLSWFQFANRLSGEQDARYPTDDPGFFHNITWECTNCGAEIYQKRDDPTLVCHTCETSYSLSKEEFPALVRAKCENCGELSNRVGGYRAENMYFDCPNCPFVWQSRRH